MAEQHHVLKGTLESMQVVWQYRSSEDTYWKDMDALYSSIHESQLRGGVGRFEYDIQYARGTKNYHYSTNLETMVQTNTNTKKDRGIRRTVILVVVDSQEPFVFSDKVESVKVVWQYWSTEDTSWKDMSNYYSDRHEGYFRDKLKYFEYDIYYQYAVDLRTMVQTNIDTTKEHNLRRILKIRVVGDL